MPRLIILTSAVLGLKRALVIGVALLLLLSFLKPLSTAATTTSSQLSIPDAINPVNPGSIPLGDGNLSTGPKAGSVYSCQTSFSGGGAVATVPWIDQSAKTWNSTSKIHVEGDVSWPSAYYNVQVSNGRRVITTNDEPIDHTTGVYPIASTDPAHQYDKNPNHIAAHNLTLTVPAVPSLADVITCVPMGPIGILSDGVVIFNALDAGGRDAAAHEVLDSCDGHPDASFLYHHHDIPSCILDKATGANTSTLVGYAIDGFGIYVERDSNGNLLTNANLDACHGRTSMVMWDGKLTMMYHYDATLEYPYSVGCFEGTPKALPYTGPITSTTPVTTTTTSSTTTSSTSTTSTSQVTSTATSTSATAYSLDVTERGLPSSGLWSVTLDGNKQSAAAGGMITFSQIASGSHTISVEATGGIFVGWSGVSGQIKMERTAPSSSGGPPQPHSFTLQLSGSGSLAFDFAQPAAPAVSNAFKIQGGKGNSSIALSRNLTVSLSIDNAPSNLDGATANTTAADLGLAPPSGTSVPPAQGATHFFDVSVSILPSPGAPQPTQQSTPLIIPVCFTGPSVASSTKPFFWNDSAWQSPPEQGASGQGTCVGVPLGLLTGTVFALVSSTSAPQTTSTSSSTASSTHNVTSTSIPVTTTSASSAGGGVPEFPPQFIWVVVLTTVVVAGYFAVRRRRPSTPPK